MWKYIVERGRPQMTIWRMRIACGIPKATNTQTGWVILVALTLQQRLHECVSVYDICTFPLLLTLNVVAHEATARL